MSRRFASQHEIDKTNPALPRPEATHCPHTLACHIHTQTLGSINSTHVSAAVSQCCDVSRVPGIPTKKALNNKRALFKVLGTKNFNYSESGASTTSTAAV